MEHLKDKSYVPGRAKRLLSHLTLGMFLFAQQQFVVAGTNIETTVGNGWTTQAVTSGNVTEISNARIIGANAYNSFEHFGVASDQTVNFRLNGSNNLVNLVRASRTDINGMLNAYIDSGSTVGGNIFFVNPHGITVGASGVVNVGSLSMVVPSQNAMDDYISAIENSSSLANDPLLFIGELQLAENGEIDIQGTINAQGGVLLLANSVNIAGGINSSATADPLETYNKGAELFSALVNVGEGFQDELGIFEVDGDIVIGAAGASGGIIDELDPVKNTSANIVINEGANIEGGSVAITASASGDDILNIAAIGSVTANIDIDNATIIANNGDVSVNATANTTATAEGTPFDLLLDAAIVEQTSKATISVDNSSLDASANVSLASASIIETRAQANASSANGDVTADAAVAVTDINSTVSVMVGNGSRLASGNNTSLTAKSDVSATTTADGTSGGDSAAGATVAVANIDMNTAVALNDTVDIDASGDLLMSASSTEIFTTKVKSTAGGASENSENTTAELNAQGREAETSEGRVSVAGALAVTDLSSVTTALLNVDAGETIDANTIDLSASSERVIETEANASATGGNTGVGVAVGITVADATTQAEVKNNVRLETKALAVKALNGATNSRITTRSISGAGATNTGVAGSLALSVVNNNNQAIIANGSLINMGASNGSLTLVSESDSEISAIAKSTQEGDGANVGVGASVAVNVANTDSIAEIEDNAQLTGAGDVSLSASGRSVVETEAQAGSAGGVSVTPVVAVTIANNTSRARLGAGSELVAGLVDVNAILSGSVSTTAGADAAGDSVGIGASLAVTVANDSSTAVTDRDIDAAGAVSFAASSDTASTTVAKASAKGADEADANGDAKAGDSDVNTKIDEQVAFGESKSDKPATDTEEADASTSEGGVSVAAAIAVNIGNSNTRATIPDTRTVNSAGLVTLRSVNAMDASASADGTQVAGDTTNVGVGAAVAINVANISNQARIGDADVTGSGITLEALMVEGASSEFNAHATSGAGSSGVGLAGALALNIGTASSEAVIVSNADVTVSGSEALTLAAQSTTENKAIAKSTQEGDEANVGVGASVAVNVSNTETIAEIEDNAELKGAAAGASVGDVSLSATGSSMVETEAQAGSAGGVSVTPVVAVTIANNTSRARIGAGSELVAGLVDVNAILTGSVSTTTGADAAGGKVAVGASIALAVSNMRTEALISRDVMSDGSVKIKASSSTSNSTLARASAAGAAADESDATTDPADKPSVNKDVDGLQTFASNKDSSGSTSSADTEKADASSEEGQVSVAAAVAVTVTDVDTVARLDNDVTITAANDVAVLSSANTDAQATADGSAVNSDIGVGVGVAINVADNNNAAYLAQGTDVQGGNIFIAATMTEDALEGETTADTVNTFAADATSGAGAAKVGVAGSLALNTVSNESRAYIAGNEMGGVAAKVYTPGELSVIASNNAKHAANAKASATGAEDSGDATSVGIGASVAINTFNNKANADIRDGVIIAGSRSLTEAGSLTIASSSEYHSATKAEAGAEGEEGASPNDIAVDAAVALVIANNETQTSIGDTDTSAGFSGNIDLGASSHQSNTTQANGDTAGSKVAIGAVAAVNLGTSITSISINSDLQTSAGTIAMDAVSTSADKALAKASAKGASKKKAQDKYGATEEEVDSGEFGNGAEDNKATSTSVLADNADTMQQSDTGNGEADSKSGDKGNWSVSFAAAVGANVVDNDTSIIVAADSTLAAAGSIDINAASDSNYMTLGSGEAVAVGDGNSSSSKGGGTGIGVGVAVTVANNDTLVEVASIESAGDVNITANSTQNMHEDFIKELTSEAIAGASADKVAIAGAVATVVTNNTTKAEIVDDSVIGNVGALNVASDDTSKISSRAVAWVDPVKGTTAGVGASAAILLSKNQNTARIGDGVSINSAASINVAATNHRVTPETVGLNFDEIINMDDVLDSALLAGRTQASGEASENTGTEPDVDPQTGGPSLIFDQLESKATDAKHALEDYIRSHNYYTEAAAGSASTGGSAKYGVAGSFAVTVLQNKTEASIGNVSINNIAGNVDVTADTDTDIAGFTGSVVKAGKVGVGVSATTLVNLDSSRALIGNDEAGAGFATLGSVINGNSVGDVNVIASSDQDILGIGVSAAAASGDSGPGVAVSGVLNTSVLINEVEARIADDSNINSSGGIAVEAEGLTDIVSVVGGIALGGKAGIGASLGTAVISGQTHAAIGDRAKLNALDSVAVDANAAEDIVSIVVGAGASKKVGVAGSLATNIIAASTTATIGEDAEVSQTEARDDQGELNSISVQATDNTSLFGLAGGGAIGGKAGVGVAADVAVFSKNTLAESKAGSVLTAGGNVDISAKSKDDIVSLTGAGAASSSGAAVAGVASVKVIVDTTHALINSRSVEANGNIDLLAQSDTDLNIYDGTIAVSGGSAGVGGAVAVNTMVKDTAAKVAAGAEIIARGDVEDSQVYNGDVDRSNYVSLGSIARPDKDDGESIGVNSGELTDSEKQTSAHRGLSVTAFSTEDIETTGISASASKSVGVAGNLSVDVIKNTTEAAIGAGARVNAVGVDATDNRSSVLVQSYDYTDLNAMLGSGALGVSSAGVGAAGDVSTINKTTTAHVDGNTHIDAEQDVAIRAASEDDIDSIAAAVGVGSSAGVSGAASVLVINNNTRAYTQSNLDPVIGNNYVMIDAGNDFMVDADTKSDVFVFNTALAAGSTAGVGGSAGVVVQTNKTEAVLGRGTVSNADSRTVISADSSEKLTGLAMGAAGGGTAGVSGQLGVHVLASDTRAIVEDDVSINKESWNDAANEDEQSVAVIASNDVALLSVAGTIALGGTAGVGGALTADVVKNHVRASVGNSEVYAGSAGNGDVELGEGLFVEDGVSIRATSEKDITTVSVAGSGGGTAGVAGAASILIVGSDSNEDDTTGESFGGDMKTFTSSSSGGDEPVSQDDGAQLAVADSGSASRTGDTLGAQGDIEVSEGVSVTQYVDANSQSSGSSYFSLDSASGTSGDTVAVVASGAKIQTKGDLEISANDNTTLNVVGGSVAVGGTAGVGGAGALVLLNQGTRAIVQDDDIEAVELDAARTMNINAQADSQIFDVTATVTVGGTAAVSGSLLLNVVDSRAEARIGNGALVNQDASLVDDDDQSVIVDANNSTSVVATTANGSGSGTAAVGGVALVNVIGSKTNASIGESARVNAQRDIKVIADASEQVIANGASAAISGAVGVGGVINVSTINTNTEARIGEGATVDSDGNVLLAAEDDTSLTANSWGVAIGLGTAGVGGSFGVNTIVKDTSAVIAEGATVNARGNNANMIDVYNGKLVSDSSGDNLLDSIIEQIEDESANESQDEKWQRIVGLSGADQTDGSTPASSTSLGNKKKDSEKVTGLAVVASSTEDILSSNASAAGGLYAGVSGSGQVLSVDTDTDATVNKDVTINASDVRLSAADHTRSFSLSGGLAISGVAGVGAALANGNFVKNTRATLGSNALAGEGVQVTASGDVIVDAESSEDIDEILVNAAAAGIAGVGGGVGVHVVVSETSAEAGNNSVIDAGNNLSILADSHTEIDAFNANLSIGGVAGVGAAVGTNVVTNSTSARMGDAANTDASEATEITANSATDVNTITLAASGGTVGVAGGVQVNVLKSTAQSSIGEGAKVNTDNNGQSVIVAAQEKSIINSDTGTIAGGAGALGGAVAVDILRNSASATVGNNAEITAVDSINITANTVKTLNATALSASAGVGGLAGSIAVAAIGGELNDEAYSQINGEDENGNENADSGSVNKAGSSINPLASDDENSQLNDFKSTSSLADDVDQRNADREEKYAVSDDVATSAGPRSATLAAIGSSAKLKAGGNLNVTAEDTTTSNMTTGAVAIGAVAASGAAAITAVDNNTEALLANNAILDAGADLSVSASNNKNLESEAVSGAIGGGLAISGSFGVTDDSSTARAHVDSGVIINQAIDTRALATQQNVAVQAVNNATINVNTGAVSGSIVGGIGGTFNVVTTRQTTEALINAGASGRVSAEGLINVAANSTATTNASSVVGAAGLGAGIAGGLVELSDTSNTSATIGEGSLIDDADEVKLAADSIRTATADTKGAAAGAVGVGGSVATVEMNGTTTALLAANAKLGSNGAIGKLNVNANATETVTAKAVALAAGIISGAGGEASSSINSIVSATIGRDTKIIANDAVSVIAQATPKALSRTTGGSFGAATVGASIAEVNVAPNVTAIIDGSDIEAGSLKVSAKVLAPASGRNADAYASAASGGLLLGANATEADTSVTGGARTLLATGSKLSIAGETEITATHNSDQYAETESFAAGLAALGGAFSSGTVNAVSQVDIADGVEITSGDLRLEARGDDKNQVKAKSGSGGAVAGAAAVAETINLSQTTVSVGNGQIEAGNVDIDAAHTARFDSETDSSSGGLLGASGAVAGNLVDAQVQVDLAGSILAESLDARSHNYVYKNLLSGFNVEAGAGGLLGGAAADGETLISRMTSLVNVAGDSSLIINQQGKTLNGDIVLEAGNTLVADDRAKLDAGGAIAIALAETSIKTTGTGISARVDIGDAATTETTIKADGNITAAAFSDVNVSTSANASTYGLAGAAQGQSSSLIQMASSIDVRNLTSMESGEETRLRAGRKADGSALSQNVRATTDLWNKTAFPVENDPEADAFLSNRNTVNIESTAVVSAVGDIYLTADKGSSNVRGVGTGKDLYRQALEDTVNFFGDLVGADDVSFDISGGSSTDLSSEAVTVNGLVNAGIDNKLKFEIRRLPNGDLAFYEGSWDTLESATEEDAFFAALTPTLTLQAGPGGLVAIDAEGNAVPVTFDVATNTFSIASSENGLSTSVALEADFNPLDKLQERLTTIGLELETLKISAGSFTQAEIDDRADFLEVSRNALAEIDTLESLRDSIQTIDATTPIEENQLAGYNQLINRIDTVDTIFAGENIATATDLDVWNLQVQGLERTKLEIENSSISAADKVNVIADVDRQISEVQTNLLDTSALINAQIGIINDSSSTATEISDARAEIVTQRGIIASYRTTLDARVSDVGNNVVTLTGVSDNALAQRDLITGSGTTEASLQPKIKRLEQEQGWIDRRVAEYDGGAGYELIDFTDKLTARSANIYVESDNLTGASNLVANRDTEVSIHNQSEAYMRISGGAEIPFASGGGIFKNNSRINSSDTGFSKIEFFNQFASSDLDAPGPDLIIDANVTNFNGLVHLKSVTGGVQTGRNVKVNGNEVKIAAGRDVILSYSGGITHVGGDVKCEFDAGADCTNSDVVSGVVAGNTVSIAGEYLNINGKVQSGFADLEFEVNGTGAGDFGIWEVQKDGTRQLVNDNGQIVYHAASGDTAAYFELKPQRIAGGFIDLYGHIISTAGESKGSLDVLDGYGRIKLTNNTDLKVMVDGLSAGTGVVGKIRITDLDHDLAGKNNTKMSEYTYNRFATDGNPVNYKVTWEKGDAVADNPFSTSNPFYQDIDQNVSENGLAYQPLQDQYYSWENFVAKGFDDRRSVERETILGLFSDTTKDPVYGNTITTITSGEPIKDELVFVFTDAERAAISGNVTGDVNGEYFNTFETVGVTATPWVASNYNKDEYVVYRLETWTETRSRTNSDYTKHFVQASNPISINFSGYSEGEISLLSTTTGGWDIAGDLRNATGATTISTAGAVTQSAGSALISARELRLAGQSFGSATGKGTASPIFNPLRINITEGGRLFDVQATDGDVILEHPDGDFMIGDINAVNGDVWLASGGDLLNDKVNYPAQDNVVSGNRVNLNAQFGSIGQIDAEGNIDFIRVNSQASTDGGVDALAADEIALTETDGDLYLRRAHASASNADVYIDIQNGSLIDNNEIEQRDERTINELLGLWDEMEFITETTGSGDTNSIGGTSETHDVAQRNVENYEANRTAEYQRYWSMRNQLDDPNASTIETTVTLSEAEANQLAEHFAGQLNKEVTDQQVLDAVSAVELERSEEFARLDNLYAELGNTFIEDFSYKLDVESKTYDDLTAKVGWTELELLARFGPGVLKEISDTDIRIEDANVSARNINLTVNNGNLGTFNTDAVLIDLDLVGDFTGLSEEQKLALLTAERKDIRIDENSFDEDRDSFTRMYISSYDDIDVEAGGTLSVTAAAAQRIYIGSESDLDLNGIVGLGDVRIRTEGHLSGSAADGIADIVGKDIILESSGQSIGSAGDYFRVSHLTDGSLTARAGDSIWLEAINAELAIDTVFAKKLFSLQTTGDVVEFEPDAGVDIRVSSLALDIGGAFGGNSLNESLDITLNPNGIIVGEVAGGAFITSPDQNLRIGNFVVGATSVISSNLDIYLDSEQRDLSRTVLNAAGEEEAFVYLSTEDKGLVSTAGSMTLIANGSILDEDDGARAIQALELDLIVGNGDIGAADNTLDVDVFGPQGIFAQAENGNMYIESPDIDLRMRKVILGGQGQFISGDASVFVDHVNNNLCVGCTIQLTARGEPFFLNFVPGRNRIETDAYALYYDEDWIVNEFSTENSLSRLVDKNLSMLTEAIPDVEYSLQADDASELVEIVEVDGDLLNLSVEDEERYLPLFWMEK